MDEARERGSRSGAPLVVVADEQTGGRGRSGRHWHGSGGLDLTFTAALDLPSGPHPLPAFTLAVGAALHAAIEPMLGRRAAALTLKWRNDLWVGERKLAGVLCESAGIPAPDGEAGAPRSLVLVGVGLNVNSSSFPPELEAVATSLSIETGRRLERVEVLAAACVAIENAARGWAASGFPAFEREYAARCLLWGRRCRVDGVEGVMRGVDATGALILDTGDGSRKLVTSGHVQTNGP
jgi:BirA family biotin operon repressor/biotin-[acetyl-CoA-carboxylase] ligase